MPPANKYDPDDKDIRHEADDERLKRETIYQKAAAWYDGDIPDVLKVKRNPTTGKAVNNNVKVNMFAKRLDRRRDFLFKKFPRLDMDDVPAESEAEKWLRQAWEWNKAATLWGLAVQNGGFTGQGYLRLLEPRLKRDKYPRCILLSNIITFWQADDVDTHLWYEIYYKVGKTLFRQDIVDLAAVDLAERGWGIYQYERAEGDKNAWEKSGEPQLWDYDLGPIVSWQHWPRASRCYGAGEFGDIQLNESVNRIMSLANAVIRNHAFPKTIVAGAEASQLTEIEPGGMWTVPKDAQVFNLEMQSDLSAILNFVERLSADYNTQGRTVDVAGGPGDFAAITNLAIKVSFMPQEDANEILKRQYGNAIVEASKRLQMLADQPYEVDPKVVWEAALPESKLEIAQVVTVEDTLGLASKETQTTQMGLDFQQEQQRMADEQADQEPPSALPEGPAIEGAMTPDMLQAMLPGQGQAPNGQNQNPRRTGSA
jgi:hypothetical protein